MFLLSKENKLEAAGAGIGVVAVVARATEVGSALRAAGTAFGGVLATEEVQTVDNMEHAVTEVALAEVGHVDKRHAAGVEAQHEQIAGKCQAGLVGEVELTDLADHLLTDSAFHRLRLGRMGLAEGVLLGDESFVDGLVVKGLQALQVEGNGVRAEAGGSEIRLVLEDDGRCELSE